MTTPRPGLVPEGFVAPLTLSGEGFLLEPLGPQHNEADLAAWASSVEHIRSTPGYPDGDWPPMQGMTADENLEDLVRHAADFEAGMGFTFTVLDPADGDVIGCVYLYPSSDPEHDVEVQSWVRADRAHLDRPLADALARWLRTDWPWQKPQRFGRPAPSAPILEDRRRRVELLLSLLAEDVHDQRWTGLGREVAQGIDAEALAREVAQGIDAEALARHVAALAAAPRHALADETQARLAGEYAARTLRDTGLDVAELAASCNGVAHPAYVATVPGRDATALAVVLVAHYDSVQGSPGADDNASGVAAALEIARVLPPAKLTADVLVAVVPFEESPGGLAGSRAVASWLKEEGRGVRAAISAEMVGFATDAPRVAGDRGDDLLVVGYPGTEVVIATLLGAANALNPGSMRGLALPEPVPEVERSDHRAFHDQGWPAVMATDGAEFRNPHYHEPSDTPDTLDQRFHLRSVQGLAAGIVALALG